MESFCPLHVDLKGRKCLVIGGGAVAERKVKIMLAYRARVTVLSPDLTPALADMLARGEIEYMADIYRPVYLKDIFMAVCTTNSPAVNRQAAEACLERSILVNTVSDPEKCTFFLPAFFKKGPLTISVSTAGKSPALARHLRDQLSSSISSDFEEFACFLGEIRPIIMEQVKDRAKRLTLLEHLAGKEFFDDFKRLSRTEIDRKVEQLLTEYGQEEQ